MVKLKDGQAKDIDFVLQMMASINKTSVESYGLSYSSDGIWFFLETEGKRTYKVRVDRISR